MKILAYLAVIGMLLTAAACSRTQQGAVVGGAVGGTLGGIWASQSSATALTGPQGAGVGIAAGGLLGALIGDQFDQMSKREIKAELENIAIQMAAKDKMLADAQAENKRLQEQIGGMQTRGLDSSIEGVEKSETSEGVVYTILESVLYTPGSATLSKKGEETLAQVVKEIEEQYPGRALNIQGHTDNQPIRRSSWKSNWELGSARALAALHYLTQKHGVKGEMISATTFGEFQPRESNTTPENMAYNRRAVVVVKPAK